MLAALPAALPRARRARGRARSACSATCTSPTSSPGDPYANAGGLAAAALSYLVLDDAVRGSRRCASMPCTRGAAGVARRPGGIKRTRNAVEHAAPGVRLLPGSRTDQTMRPSERWVRFADRHRRPILAPAPRPRSRGSSARCGSTPTCARTFRAAAVVEQERRRPRAGHRARGRVRRADRHPLRRRPAHVAALRRRPRREAGGGAEGARPLGGVPGRRGRSTSTGRACCSSRRRRELEELRDVLAARIAWERARGGRRRPAPRRTSRGSSQRLGGERKELLGRFRDGYTMGDVPGPGKPGEKMTILAMIVRLGSTPGDYGKVAALDERRPRDGEGARSEEVRAVARGELRRLRHLDRDGARRARGGPRLGDAPRHPRGRRLRRDLQPHLEGGPARSASRSSPARSRPSASPSSLVGHLNSNTAFLGSIVVGNGINVGLILFARYLEERRHGAGPLPAMEIAVRTHLARDPHRRARRRRRPTPRSSPPTSAASTSSASSAGWAWRSRGCSPT